MVTKPVPITGSVLRWAIHDAGWPSAAFADELGVSQEQLARWELDLEKPNSGEFDRIVRLLKRPPEFFLLPEPPQTERPDTRLRGAPQSQLRDLNPDEHRWLRRSVQLQEVASWILRSLRQGPTFVAKASVSDDPEKVAKSARTQFEISFREQLDWNSAYQALREWRNALEERGILVFQLSLGKGNARGFALWEDWSPVITINSSYTPEARIFTMFHEYAHLLLRQDDIMISSVSQLPPQIITAEERWCERFAASFLMPRDDVRAYVREQILRDEAKQIDTFVQVRRISRHFKVSLRATALRLTELGLGTEDLYRLVVITANQSTSGGGGGGAARYIRRTREYGTLLPRILLWAMDDGILAKHDVLDYLQISRTDLAILENDLGA